MVAVGVVVVVVVAVGVGVAVVVVVAVAVGVAVGVGVVVVVAVAVGVGVGVVVGVAVGVAVVTRQRTCSPCLRGHHSSCTAGKACECETCNPLEQPVEVRWEDPPETRGKNRRHLDEDLVAELRRHPKRWARVKDFNSKSSASSAAKSQKNDRWPQCPAEEFEAVARTIGGGSALWLRYVGEPHE